MHAAHWQMAALASKPSNQLTIFMHGPFSVHGLAPLYGPHQTEQSDPKRATRGTVPCESGSPTWVSGREAASNKVRSVHWLQCHLLKPAFVPSHGVGPCLTDPLGAMLPLLVHCYGNKDSIHELDNIRAMPYMCQ